MVITKAPLRVSFLGGGTDYPEYFLQEGGAILGTAIDKFACITANHFYSALFDYSIRLAYRKVELANALDDISHTPFREALRYCGVTRDIELNYFADLPAFTGLGSSSSFTVALLQALHAHCGRFSSGIDLAYQAIHLERHVFGDRVGCQDQVLAAVGGLNLIEFRAEDDILVHRLQLPPLRLRALQDSLMLVFTGFKRSASEIAGKQIDRVDQNRPILRRMRGLADAGAALLTSGRSLTAFGELLHESWMLKRSLEAGVSKSEIDIMYAAAREAGAIGGKLLGAGGGGFLLFFVPPEKRSAVRAALGNVSVLPISLGASGCQILQQDSSPSHQNSGRRPVYSPVERVLEPQFVS